MSKELKLVENFRKDLGLWAAMPPHYWRLHRRYQCARSLGRQRNIYLGVKLGRSELRLWYLNRVMEKFFYDQADVRPRTGYQNMFSGINIFSVLSRTQSGGVCTG